MLCWYDTHTHYTDDRYAEDLDETLARARSAGVGYLNLIAYDLPSSFEVVDFCQQHENCFAVVGIHPHDADSWNAETEARLRDLLEKKEQHRIVAVGEIGYDFYYDHSPRSAQEKAFWAQIQLAHDYRLPLVIHNREAHEATYTLLDEAAKEGLLLEEAPGVIHCYSGSAQMALRFLGLGFYLGLDGPVTFKNAKQPLEVAAELPLDRLVLETDCPYLTPHPYRGKRNESAYLPLVGEKIAAVRAISLEELAQQTSANGYRLFRVPPYGN